MTLLRLILALVLIWAGQAAPVHAHALEPGYLDISRVGGDSFRVFWLRPDVQGRPMAIEARLPETCDPRTGPAPGSDGRAWSSTWVATCPGGLTGGEIVIEGLEQTRTDVLIRYEAESGAVQTHRLTADNTAFRVAGDPGVLDVVASYVPLGIKHILEGLDHLLFVFALLLLIPDGWRLAGAITAFTVAHSITMAVATLGWVSLPAPPVEATIALSIIFLASELLHREGGGTRLSERYPWTVSFAFGLLHGFGFAGALLEIGLPQADIPLALLSFNIGVEIGQLIFVAAVLVAGAALRRAWPAAQTLMAPGTRTAALGAYAIGTLAAFWFIDRVASF